MLVQRATLLVLSAALVVACGDEHPAVPTADVPLNLSISDGASGGNDEFFFFPPLVDDPTGEPTFDEGAFNEYLNPFVRICQPDVPSAGECQAVPDQDGNVDLPMVVDGDNEWYKVNWKTGDFDLIPGEYYRIQVWVGSTEVESNLLGYRDVIPLDGPPVASCSTDDEYCQFNNGSTVPIKVRIEDGAFCPLIDGERIPCQTKSFDLSGGVSFNLEDQYRLDVPEQPFASQGTVTFQECTVDTVANRIDLPTFGPCLETVVLTPDFDGVLDPNATATISFCDVDPDAFGLSPEQTANLRVHHLRDDGGVEALRPDLNCPVSTTSRSASPIRQFASRLLSWIGPRPLEASALATKGMGGNSLDGMRSLFKVALPAKIDFVSVSDATRTALVGSSLTTQAVVTDLNGDAVAGATVRWNVDPAGGAEGADVAGSVGASSAGCTAGSDDDVVCTTDESGIVEVDWVLAADPGINKLTAGGRGIADSREEFNGPRGEDEVVYPLGAFDPFQPIGYAESPDDTIATPYQESYEPLVPGTRLLFTAIGCEAGFGTPTAIDGTMDSGEWDCANQMTFPVNLSGGSTVDATLYYMNDDTAFHVAVVVPGTDRQNSLRIEWDSDGDGTAGGRELGDDVWEFDPDDGPADKFVDDKCSTSSQSGCGADDESSTYPGVMDTDAAFDNSGGETVYEMSHPLWTDQTCEPVGGKKGCSSAFPIDLRASAGDVRGFFVTLQLGNGAQGNTQWPGFLDYLTITIK